MNSIPQLLKRPFQFPDISRPWNNPAFICRNIKDESRGGAGLNPFSQTGSQGAGSSSSSSSSLSSVSSSPSSSMSSEAVSNHDYHDHQFKSSSGGEGGGHNASSQLEMFLLERAKALHTSSGAPMHLNGGSGGPPNPFGAPNNPFLGHPGFPGIRSGLFPGSKTDKEFNNHDY